ncbi:PKD domain-containing protein [Hymenobacter gummosus]|uniref:PKD domain-containing protein n=2 Tax=Hymenobacter gummosus TaxID=1776032 RepID=A0A431U815_9BACT|nr:PKD domain-containing protein [Hymenobacter gummosus]
MAAGTWNADNDPDNHFIADDLLRTFLNDKGEYKIGNTIYIFPTESKYIEITDNDWAALDDYHADNPGFFARATVKLHTLFPTVAEVGGCSDFTVRRVSSRYYEFDPINRYAGATYAWDFGDGTTSNQMAPGHTYATEGAYTVTVTVRGVQCTGSTLRVVRTPNAACSTSIPSSAVSFTHSVNEQTLTFTLQQVNATYTYQWDYGDHSIIEPARRITSPTFIHTYPNSDEDEEYFVVLTVRNPQGCILQSAPYRVVVPKINCKKPGFTIHERGDERDFGTNNDKKFKSVIWATCYPLYRYVGVKTKSFRKRNNRWQDYNVASIGAEICGSFINFQGQPSGASCTALGPTSFGCRRDNDTNDDKVKHDYNIGRPYGLLMRSLTSNHYVVDNGVRYDYQMTYPINP